MSTVNQFVEYYKNASNAELLAAINSPCDYQPEALEIIQRELEGRQLSAEEIQETEMILLARKDEKEKQQARVRLVQKKIKSGAAMAEGHLNMVQKERPSPAKHVRNICIVYCLLFLYSLFSNITYYEALVVDTFQRDFFYSISLIAIVLLPTSIVYLWRKKKIGWVLFTGYLIFSLLQSGWFLYRLLTLEANAAEFIGSFIINTTPFDYPLGPNLIRGLFFSATLFVVCRAEIRSIFKVDKQYMLITLLLSGVICGTLLLL